MKPAWCTRKTVRKGQEAKTGLPLVSAAVSSPAVSSLGAAGLPVVLKQGRSVTVYDMTGHSSDTSPDTRFSTDSAAIFPAGGSEATFPFGVPADAEAVCPSSNALNAGILHFSSESDICAWLFAVASHSPSVRVLLRRAGQQCWSVGFRTLHNDGYMLDTAEKTVYLDDFSLMPSSLGRSAFFRHNLALNLIRALRDIGHDGRGADNAGLYAPEDLLLLERVRAADCDTFAILAAWELRSAGFADIWRHMIGSPEGDMALAFTQHLERDPRAQFTGAALAQAFRTWYTDEARVDACDHETLEMLDERIAAAEQGQAPFGRQPLQARAVEILACLPDSTCYLAGLGERVRKDPYFAGLKDPINQAHLFHIAHDLKVTTVCDVPFRDAALARKIFPDAPVRENWSLR